MHFTQSTASKSGAVNLWSDVISSLNFSCQRKPLFILQIPVYKTQNPNAKTHTHTHNLFHPEKSCYYPGVIINYNQTNDCGSWPNEIPKVDIYELHTVHIIYPEI